MEVDGTDSLNFPSSALTEENETGEELPIEEITKSEKEKISEQPDFEKELDIAIEDISENQHQKLRTLVYQVCRFARHEDTLEVHPDACDYGIGGQLWVFIEERRHPSFCVSLLFKPNEK